MNRNKLFVALALFASVLLMWPVVGFVPAALCLVVGCALLLPQTAMVRVATLSVPELLMDVMDAFTLELFNLGFFATDFSSQTAVKGDKITAHISVLPVVGQYDANNGGFKNGAQAAEGLLVDVPVTLDQFPIVTIKVGWLSQLASKMPLYKEAVRNYGYVLAKQVLDFALTKAVNANFSHKVIQAIPNVSLDTLDGQIGGGNGIRTQLNAQKAAPFGRFGIVNSQWASQFGSDDRVKSALFYNQLNGDSGYRIWKNIAGFGQIVEYPDLPNNGENLAGIFGDKRAFALASRRIDFANAAAEAFGVPQVMNFYPMTHEDTGLNFTGVTWQEAGTGDVYVAAGALFGIGAGDQGGAADSITGAAAVRQVTQ
jgi:hypothetical protein